MTNPAQARIDYLEATLLMFIVDRYDAACLRLHRAGVKFTPDGRPYLEETA